MDKEIFWNLVNAALAGGLVFLGGCSTGEVTATTVLYALIAGLMAGAIQFKTYIQKYLNSDVQTSTIKLFKFL